jgi:hypothetical protein
LSFFLLLLFFVCVCLSICLSNHLPTNLPNWLPACLSFCLSVCLSVYLPIYHLSITHPTINHPSVRPSVRPPARPPIRPSICLSIYLPIFLRYNFQFCCPSFLSAITSRTVSFPFNVTRSVIMTPRMGYDTIKMLCMCKATQRQTGASSYLERDLDT